MTTKLSAEQVLALAPDSASAKAGQKLAVTSKWLTLGVNSEAMWGECTGSGKKPYQTRIDLNGGPAFKCSCPSRKFPCKHAIGLMLLHTANPGAFKDKTAPDWVQDWLDDRAKRATRAASPTTISDLKAKAKREAKRLESIQNGLADFDLFLRDMVRNGFASLKGSGYGWADARAKRLVDAKVDAHSLIARTVHELGSIPNQGQGWPSAMLDAVSRLHLVAEGFARYDDLPQPVQGDLRGAVGWPYKMVDLAETPGVQDQWTVLGKRTEPVNNKLKVQRLYLTGTASGATAQLVDYAQTTTPSFENNYVPGTTINAELVFFPSAYPLRALVRQHTGDADPSDTLPTFANFDTALEAYAIALAANPWLERFPMTFEAVLPLFHEGYFYLADTNGTLLRCSVSDYMELYAFSGGEPVWLFGDWDGASLYPMTAVLSGRTLTLS